MQGMIDPPKFELTFFFCPKAYGRGERLSMGLTASQGHEPLRRTIRAGLALLALADIAVTSNDVRLTGDASGLPFSMTKVSISLLPDIEQASWGVWGNVSYESPAGFPSILSTKSPCMT
jgi:hypothetical protein